MLKIESLRTVFVGSVAGLSFLTNVTFGHCDASCQGNVADFKKITDDIVRVIRRKDEELVGDKDDDGESLGPDLLEGNYYFMKR